MEQREQLLNLHRVRSMEGGLQTPWKVGVCRRVGLKFRVALANWRNGLGEKKQDTNLEAPCRDRNTQFHDTGRGMADSIVVLQKKVCELELGCAGGSFA